MKKTAIVASVILGAGMAGSVSAQNLEFDPANFYAGGGLGINNASNADNSPIGPNLFAGYNLGEIFGVEKLDLMVELGYMDTGDFEYTSRTFFGNRVTVENNAAGVWSTGVVRYNLNDTWGFFGRLGLDFGDDDGVMLGGGAEYNLTDQFDLRGEVAIRDNITSFQGNVVWDF